LVAADRQFFLAAHGLPAPLAAARQTGLDYSICQYAVASGRPLIVGDLRADAVLGGHRVVGEFGVAAYAGIPLYSPDVYPLGTLCVADYVGRDWDDQHLATLAALADIVTEEITGRIGGLYPVREIRKSQCERTARAASVDDGATAGA
jgi:GAF domain-containing protein